MQEISLHQIRKHFEHFMNGNLFWKRRLGYWTCIAAIFRQLRNGAIYWKP